jgi:4-hydroxy-3-methylbut-2-enyl diphosphate reductase
MKIRLAQTAGFCMGVRRAVDIALDIRRMNTPRPVVTYGPLIHNPQTLELLESRGVRSVDSLDLITEGTVIIRAHGISPRERQVLQDKGVAVIDATCPRVAGVQAILARHAGKGWFAVIIGEENHPEVRGLLGFASAGGIALGSLEDLVLLEKVPHERDVVVVAQTTQDEATFQELLRAVQTRFPRCKAHKTICDSTRKRQEEVRNLARRSDLLVVVGGRGSGNTRRLVKVAAAEGARALHVETADEIPPEAFLGVRNVAVTAGASTPNWQIQRVIHRLQEIGRSRSMTAARLMRKLADVAIMTYVWGAVGGLGLGVACRALQGLPLKVASLGVTALFVFSMHLLNRIIEGAQAVRFSTPETAAFYAKWRAPLSVLGALSSLAALTLSASLGAASLALVASMIVGGFLYSLPLSLPPWSPLAKWGAVRNIPGSKTVLVAVGWAMAAALLPAADSGFGLFGGSPGAVWTSFAFAAGMVFWRTALSDLLDIQGDRMVGRETIPILLGVEKTGRLLVGTLVFLGAGLVGTAALGLVPSLGYALLVPVALFAALFLAYRKHRLVDRLFFEGMLDGVLVCVGLAALAWSAW